MNKQFLVFFGTGVVALVIAVAVILTANKGSHLELKGDILKVRTGALSDEDSIAVLDFRVENPSNVPFVVREVDVMLEKKDGSKVDGITVSKVDLKQLFGYNRFLGDQYNESLSLKDTIPPHATVDRMVAARFEVKNQDLESAKAFHLTIQDVDGPLFETSKTLK